MDLPTYRQAVQRLTYGKQLPAAVYVYRDAGSDFGRELNELVRIRLARGFSPQ